MLSGMNSTQSFEQMIESRHARRQSREGRELGKIERREAKAEKMIGTVMRDNREMSYIWPVGGLYREGNRVELISFLIRNNHA